MRVCIRVVYIHANIKKRYCGRVCVCRYVLYIRVCMYIYVLVIKKGFVVEYVYVGMYYI